MTERERLIDIVGNYDFDATICNLCERPDEDCEKCSCEIFTDYFLNNGVIVPPCKVGDWVYVIDCCRCYNSDVKGCRERQEKYSTRKYILAVNAPSKIGTKCFKVFKRKFKKEWVFKVGKTVFLTSEEAEKVLKERKENA